MLVKSSLQTLLQTNTSNDNGLKSGKTDDAQLAVMQQAQGVAEQGGVQDDLLQDDPEEVVSNPVDEHTDDGTVDSGTCMYTIMHIIICTSRGAFLIFYYF